MKLYTRTGDAGQTGLHGKLRVPKDSPIMHAIGHVDELNAALGLCLSVCHHEALTRILHDIQNHLFELGADLATPSEDTPPVTPDTTDAPNSPATPTDSHHPPGITVQLITHIEQTIDDICRPLPPLRTFILPGGCQLAAHLHLARTLARRAERHILTLSQHQKINPQILIYINRLSDLLFALARRANQLECVDDTPWPTMP